MSEDDKDTVKIVDVISELDKIMDRASSTQSTGAFESCIGEYMDRLEKILKANDE